jgi:hypothetical protein
VSRTDRINRIGALISDRINRIIGALILAQWAACLVFVLGKISASRAIQATAFVAAAIFVVCRIDANKRIT